MSLTNAQRQARHRTKQRTQIRVADEMTAVLAEGITLMRRQLGILREQGVTPNDGSDRGRIMAEIEEFIRAQGLTP